MADTLRTIQPTFAGGEFAPNLYSRVDLQKYSTGLKTAKNFFVHPHGGASNRPGTYFVAETRDSTKASRLIPFEFSTTQTYILEFGDEYVRFFSNHGAILPDSPTGWDAETVYAINTFVTYESVTYRALKAGQGKQPDLEPTYWVASPVYEITSPYSSSDLVDLKYVQSADVLYIVHPQHAPQMLTRIDHDLWAFSDFIFTNGPLMSENDSATTLAVSAKTGGATLTSSTSLFTANNVGSVFSIRHDIAGQTASSGLAALDAVTSSLTMGGDANWRIITHGTWTGTIKVEKSLDGGSTWLEVRAFSSANDFNVNTYGTVDTDKNNATGTVAGTCVMRVKMAAYTSGTCNVDFSIDPFSHTGCIKVTGYTSATSVSGITQTDFVSTAASTMWSEGSWSPARGYPTCVMFYQDRLCFASTESEPQSIWMSQTSNYTEFAVSQPIVDSDSIGINLPSRQMNGIKNMIALAEIMALTSSSEWSVGPGSSGVITPTSVLTRAQGYRGSSAVSPVIIGNRAIYVLPMGSTLRDFGYDFAANGFSGDDLSIFARHLFERHEVIELAYQQEPDSIVWALRDDGVLLSLTYVKEQQVLAWTHHETDGDVESIATIPYSGQNELWMIVKRGSDRFIERMAARMETTDPKLQYFVDCGLSYLGYTGSAPVITGATKANPVVITSVAHGLSNGDLVDIDDVGGMTEINGLRFTVANKTADTFELSGVNGTAYTAYTSGGTFRKALTSLSGFDHLDGKEVAILADGSVLPTQTVTGGTITLNPAASIVHAGLAYEADLETLNVEISMPDGTAQGRLIKIPEVTLRFLNSRGGWAGPDDAHLDELIQRTGEPMGSPIELYSGDYRMTLNANYDSNGRIFYRQIDPLPVTILAVIPVVSPGG